MIDEVVLMTKEFNNKREFIEELLNNELIVFIRENKLIDDNELKKIIIQENILKNVFDYIKSIPNDFIDKLIKKRLNKFIKETTAEYNETFSNIPPYYIMKDSDGTIAKEVKFFLVEDDGTKFVNALKPEKVKDFSKIAENNGFELKIYTTGGFDLIARDDANPINVLKELIGEPAMKDIFPFLDKNSEELVDIAALPDVADAPKKMEFIHGLFTGATAEIAPYLAADDKYPYKLLTDFVTLISRIIIKPFAQREYEEKDKKMQLSQGPFLRAQATTYLSFIASAQGKIRKILDKIGSEPTSTVIEQAEEDEETQKEVISKREEQLKNYYKALSMLKKIIEVYTAQKPTKFFKMVSGKKTLFQALQVRTDEIAKDVEELNKVIDELNKNIPNEKVLGKFDAEVMSKYPKKQIYDFLLPLAVIVDRLDNKKSLQTLNLQDAHKENLNKFDSLTFTPPSTSGEEIKKAIKTKGLFLANYLATRKFPLAYSETNTLILLLVLDPTKADYFKKASDKVKATLGEEAKKQFVKFISDGGLTAEKLQKKLRDIIGYPPPPPSPKRDDVYESKNKKIAKSIIKLVEHQTQRIKHG